MSEINAVIYSPQNVFRTSLLPVIYTMYCLLKLMCEIMPGKKKEYEDDYVVMGKGSSLESWGKIEIRQKKIKVLEGLRGCLRGICL